MARLLNVAKVVLLDTVKRTEYDDILRAWEDPVSKDGTPIIRIDDASRKEASSKTPEQIEAAFDAQRQQVTTMVGYNPKQHALLEKMFNSAEGEDKLEIRESLEESLLAQDRALAIEEAERSQLLGFQAHDRYQTKLGYAKEVVGMIDAARGEIIETQVRRQLGATGIRLALLSGQTPDPLLIELATASPVLPGYFEGQAEKIAALAAQREEILEKRLELFVPEYPIDQSVAHELFVLGFTANPEAVDYRWTAFRFDTADVSVANIAVPADIAQMLNAGEFEAVYNYGLNVARFSLLDQIDTNDLLQEAVNKHLQKFFPDLLLSDD